MEGNDPPTNTTAAADNGKNTGRRPVLWLFAGVALGLLLPACACGAFLLSGALLTPFQTTTQSGFGDAVAIVPVEGAIVSGDANDFAATAGAVSGIVIDDLERANNDPTVKAIVLSVDTPGGSVTGSAQIYEAIQRLDKPVVTSMGALAASGGYYVSAPTDYIIARPDTWTGSIGVIAQIINAEELLNDLGVEATLITSGENKAFGSLWRRLTPEQEAILQTLVDESFADFVQVIVDGRNLSREEVLALADGRIYSGRQAVDNGLADSLGNLQEAIDKAAELGGIAGEPRIVRYERAPGLRQLLTGFATRFTQTEAGRIRESLIDLTTPTLEYRYVGPGLQ